MITVDTTRDVPTAWTDNDLRAFAFHAQHLAQNGNIAGFGMQVDLFPFMGEEDEHGRGYRSWSEWDYDGMRTWMADHHEQVECVWQFQVLPDWW